MNQILNYEGRLRKHAYKLMNTKGTRFDRALKLARENTDLKQRYLLTPMAASPRPAAMASEGDGQRTPWQPRDEWRGRASSGRDGQGGGTGVAGSTERGAPQR